MFNFSEVKEVTLSRGSHTSPEQGMCFMEMAAWFAGEEHSDKPACVSPSLGVLGIHLNDTMPERLRDTILKPMIPHVVGTADGKAESRRAEYICLRAFNYSIGILAPDTTRQFGIARSYGETGHIWRSVMERMRFEQSNMQGRGHLALADAIHQMMRYQADLTPLHFNSFVPVSVALDYSFEHPNKENAKYAAMIFALVAEMIPDWSAGIDTLREAIKLGRHDGFDAVADLPKRHEKLRELVSA